MFDVSKYTGSGYCYDYSELFEQATSDQVRDYCIATRTQFLPIAKKFTDKDNGLWTLRHYLALKFAISASVMSGSAIYAHEHNLLMAVPYFNYYAILNCCRAFLMTSPDVRWDGKATVEMTHSKILNVTGDLLRRLDPSPERQWTERLKRARESRELYSYRFPATGPSLVGAESFSPQEAASFARLIAELAMLNSECFDAVLEKHAPENLSIPDLPDHDWADRYDIAGSRTLDQYDSERFGKLVRGLGRVTTLQLMTSDGMIEDFYGAWVAEEPTPTGFDPDEYMRHLLVL